MKKIIHVCLANFYVDNYSYQENILPKEHKNLGYQVFIIASTETYIDNKHLGYLKPATYVNEYGIIVHRLPYLRLFPRLVMKKIRSYQGLFRKLRTIKPNIIFVHDVQFIDALKITIYALMTNEVDVYVDCHADYGNSAKNFLSREILHKIFYKFCAHVLNIVAIKFWGVLPSRVDFLREVYNIPRYKIDLLLMGAEEKYCHLKLKDDFVETQKKFLAIPRGRKVVVTGGKIDAEKVETLAVLEAVGRFRNKIELFLFGSITDDLRGHLDTLLKKAPNLHYLGWLSVEETYRTLAIADLAIFPSGHSVLWEQAVALGLPLAVKYGKNSEHLDIGNNIVWLTGCTVTDFEKLMEEWLLDKNFYKLKNSALSERRLMFSYTKIASRSIFHSVATSTKLDNDSRS